MESKNPEDEDTETGRRLTYWGRHLPVGELCSKCQRGTKCFGGTYDAPRALDGFFIVDLDISADSARPQPSEQENLIDKRMRRDYDRALEKFRYNNRRVCPGERLLDSVADSGILRDYPFAAATKRDFCPTAQPCKPKEACLSGNKCEIGYQYQELRCKASSARRDTASVPVVQPCNHTLQCQSVSSGAECTSALSTVCDCPADWELNSRSCMVNCLRDTGKLRELENAG